MGVVRLPKSNELPFSSRVFPVHHVTAPSDSRTTRMRRGDARVREPATKRGIRQGASGGLRDPTVPLESFSVESDGGARIHWAGPQGLRPAPPPRKMNLLSCILQVKNIQRQILDPSLQRQILLHLHAVWKPCAKDSLAPLVPRVQHL